MSFCSNKVIILSSVHSRRGGWVAAVCLKVIAVSFDNNNKSVLMERCSVLIYFACSCFSVGSQRWSNDVPNET